MNEAVCASRMRVARAAAHARCASIRHRVLPKTGRAYLGTKSSRKKVRRICGAISERTGRHTTLLSAEQLVAQLNRMLVGWANYFCLGPIERSIST